jgi:Uma2 family endonuclease
MAHPVDYVPAPPRPRMTFDEFLHSPYPRAEWVDGEVFELSPENLDYQGVAGLLHPVLRSWVEQHDLGHVFLNYLMRSRPELPVRAPDIMFVAKANQHRILRNFVEGPADLVVEIVSPDSASRDRVVKRREYREGGVPEYWLIDPLEGRAHFLALEVGEYAPLPVDADGVVHSRVLSGVWLKPEWLLGEPRPRITEIQRAWGLI